MSSLVRQRCFHRCIGSRRCRSTYLKSFTTRAAEKVTVPCRSNGEITLDIHLPVSSPEATSSASAVVIYLPRGPFSFDPEHDATTVSILRSVLPCYVVQLNYRLGSKHHYPIPVHDVLTGYTWVLEHLLPKRGISRSGRAEHVGRLAVCGELIGGGLATMLALTECRMGQPGVVAASVSNAIVDWSDIGDDRTSIAARMSGKHALDSTTESLLRLRRQLFRRPEQYFDPFASPLLFFRSSSQSVPSAGPEPPLDDLAQLSLIEREDFFREQAALSAVSWQTSKVPEQGAPGKAKRKTSRRYPSPAYGLRLPSFQMSAGTALPFQQQATELAHQARQSFTRQESASSFGRKVLTDDEVESLTESGEHSTQQQQEFMARDKIDLVVHEGQGLWDMSDAGKERVEVTASWLKTKLASV